MKSEHQLIQYTIIMKFQGSEYYYITDNKSCPFCNKKVKILDSELSYKEYKISGLCQNCQNDLFGLEENINM